MIMKTTANKFQFRDIIHFIKISFSISPTYSILKFILTLLSALLPIVYAFLWKIIIDDIIVIEKSKNAVYFAIVGSYCFLFVLNGILKYWHEYVDRIYANELEVYTEQKEIETCSKFDISYFDDNEKQSKNKELSKAYRSSADMSWGLFDLICNFISFFISVLIVGSYNILLAVITILLTFPKYLFQRFSEKKNREFNIAIAGEQRFMNYYRDAMQNGEILLEIKLNNAENYFTQRYLDLNHQLNKKMMRHKTLYGLLTLGFDLIANISFFAVVILTLFDALRGNISIGTVQYSWNIVENLKNRCESILHNITKLKNNRERMSLLANFIGETTAIESSQGAACPTDNFVIEFDHVSFTYPGTEAKILNDVSFTIHAGEKVGLVGVNGSGKTTMTKLMMRFYDPDTGRICVNGKDIRTFDVNSVRALFSTMFQENPPYVFIPIRDGIALSRYDQRENDGRLDDACEKSGFAAVLKAKNADYDMILNDPLCIQMDNSLNLSGGEWQKLALARTYFRDTNFYIFDEPSASLDVFAEQKIFDDFSRLACNRSAVLISHRLANMKFCDRILVLENGTIIEQGPHEELLAKKGRYAQLFSLQANRYKE